jgi:hypothetical protein
MPRISQAVERHDVVIFYYDSQLSAARSTHVGASEGRLLQIERRTAARLSV